MYLIQVNYIFLEATFKMVQHTWSGCFHDEIYISDPKMHRGISNGENKIHKNGRIKIVQKRVLSWS